MSSAGGLSQLAPPRPGTHSQAHAPRVAALVLAAGAGTRFGGGKVRATLEGRPLLAHVLEAARAAGLSRIVLVLGRDAVVTCAALRDADPDALAGVLVAVNGTPERGLASSLRVGLAAATAEYPRGAFAWTVTRPTHPAATDAGPGPAGVVVLLGDQPRVRADVITALMAALVAAPATTLAVAPTYAGDEAPNPALLLPPVWPLAAALEGDRGLGPLLAAERRRILRVPVAGSNPDVDTPADLAALEGSTS